MIAPQGPSKSLSTIVNVSKIVLQTPEYDKSLIKNTRSQTNIADIASTSESTCLKRQYITKSNVIIITQERRPSN